jgi:hypothetical protein
LSGSSEEEEALSIGGDRQSAVVRLQHVTWDEYWVEMLRTGNQVLRNRLFLGAVFESEMDGRATASCKGALSRSLKALRVIQRQSLRAVPWAVKKRLVVLRKAKAEK